MSLFGQLKADTDSLNYLSSTRAVLQIVGLESVSFTCTDFHLPGITLAEARVENPFISIPLHGDKIEFSPLSISFLVTAKLENWLALYNWIKGLGYPGSQQEYCQRPLTYTDGVLHLYTPQNNKFGEVLFEGLVPTSIGDLDFTTQQSTNDELIATATFAYQNYKVDIK